MQISWICYDPCLRCDQNHNLLFLLLYKCDAVLINKRNDSPLLLSRWINGLLLLLPASYAQRSIVQIQVQMILSVSYVLTYLMSLESEQKFQQINSSVTELVDQSRVGVKDYMPLPGLLKCDCQKKKSIISYYKLNQTFTSYPCRIRYYIVYTKIMFSTSGYALDTAGESLFFHLFSGKWRWEAAPSILPTAQTLCCYYCTTLCQVSRDFACIPIFWVIAA